MATRSSTRRRRTASGSVRKANWRSDVKRLRKDFAAAGAHGQHALKAVRHNAAVAAFQWVASHKGRVTAFRKAIRGTGAEKAVNSALRALEREATATATAKSPPRRRRRKSAKAVRRATARRAARPPMERFLTPPMF